MSTTQVSPDFGTNHAGAIETETLSAALIGPNEERRSAVANALAETRRATVREFDSYPPGPDHLQRLVARFDVIIIDLDSDPDAALELVEKVSATGAATIMVYSENSDQQLAMRFMRAGAREYLLLPLDQGALTEALVRSHKKALSGEKTLGGVLVFAGSKGGSGVTTVGCNIAIALAQKFDQRTLLIDLALPIGDAALCLGISSGYSTEDALRNIDRMDASFLQNLVVKHRSGVFVLAAPTKVPEVEVSRGAIEKLIAIARSEFDQVIVDVGSRIDEAAKILFEVATSVYLVTQKGISELRNSNRLISQFFSDGNPNLQIVINRFDSHFHATANDEVVAKALGRPVRWKIPNDHDAARALQSGDTGLPETRLSRISLEMASSITGLPIPQEMNMDFGLRAPGRSIAQVNPGMDEAPSAPALSVADARMTPTITWPPPDMITYGEKLTFAQLNATSSAEGTLVYTPGPGYLLPAGMHTLWVTFTPESSGAYSPLQVAVSIVVAKATPLLTWRAPARIICGTALDDTQLNASSPVPGIFNYSHAAGDVLPPGTHTLSVTFTPEDSANYATAQATVQLTVVKAAPAIQWPKLDRITYGTKLGDTQLCAESPVPGTFEYNPGSGALLAAGEHKLSVVFTPADTAAYSPAQTSVSLTVAKAAPAITWPTPDPITQGAALGATQLDAAAAAPGTFVYKPAAGEILKPGAHELSVNFTPADTLNYTSARAFVRLTVNEKSSPLITWPAPSAISYGTELNDAQLNATASVPGTFVYTPSAGHVLAQGRYTLSASFTPVDMEEYAPAQATVVLEVQAPPDISPLLTAAIEAAPSEVMGERTATKTILRETRIYKGAVYEKGEDDQWHLQKK